MAFSRIVRWLVALLFLTLLCSACSEEVRSKLEQPQIEVVLALNLQNEALRLEKDTVSFPFNADSSNRYRAVIEVCLFNDSNKVREYTSAIHPLTPDTWLTDTLQMIHPGLRAHLIQKVMIFDKDDFEHPLYASTLQPLNGSRCSLTGQLPVFVEVFKNNELLASTLHLSIQLFNAWLSQPACFGYKCWKQLSESNRTLSFLVCNTTRNDSDAPRKMGKLTLSKLNRQDGILFADVIDRQIFIQEVRTTLNLPEAVASEALFELRLAIPDEINPEIIITDTLTGMQLKEVRQSGFWLAEPGEPESGVILFDLATLRQETSGLFSAVDSVQYPYEWTPSFIQAFHQ